MTDQTETATSRLELVVVCEGLARLAASLDALSPLSVLARGYAIARDASGRVVRGADELVPGGEVRVLLGRGSFDATVLRTHDEGSVSPEGI